MNFHTKGLVGLSLLLLAGCGDDEDHIVCTLIAVPGLEITIVDSVTSAPVIDAFVLARDGAFVDTLMVWDNTAQGAWERTGVYEVTVEKEGYLMWKKSGVLVEGDVCHVHTVKATALLQPDL